MEKKPIRLRFSDSAPKPKQPTATTSSRAKALVVGTEKLSAKCGHFTVFELFAKDPYREQRRANHQARDCKDCIATRVSAEQEAAEARREQRKLKDRLPDQSAFHVEFDANAVRWRGTLSTIVDDKPEVFTGEAPAVFRLLRKLDDAYRKRSATGSATAR